MIPNTRNFIKSEYSKESFNCLCGSVYKRPTNYPYKKRNISSTHNNSLTKSSETDLNTIQYPRLISKETVEFENKLLKLPLLSISNIKQVNSLLKRSNLRLKKKIKDKVMLLAEHCKLTKPSVFNSQFKQDLILKQRTEGITLEDYKGANEYYNTNSNSNSNSNSTSKRFSNHHPKTLSRISSNHNINTYSHYYNDRNNPKSQSEVHLELTSLKKVVYIPIKGKKPNKLFQSFSMNDIKANDALDSNLLLINKMKDKVKAGNWNFFTKEELRNNINNSNIDHISKYESPMKVIQNENLMKAILINNLSNMGKLQL